MNVPEDRRYTTEHEWAALEDGVVTVGITDYAQEQLGEIVFVELPKEGDVIKKDETFGAVESTKTASDLYAPMSGKVIEVNDPLADSPGVVNEDPYEEGWMIRVEVSDEDEFEGLLTAAGYKKIIAEAAE
ncbi:MAG: glycine cleavage system protein GcvH [Deltaproteobacteria bacterium]|nr:glycine cleavage system protein GcvH [Deltaproteobacteria bacterium]